MTPAREVFRNFSTTSQYAFYALASLTCLIFAYGLWRRVQKYRRGRSDNRFDHLWQRLLRAASLIGRSATLARRDAYAGWAHGILFWGFAILFVGTVIVFIDYDLLRPLGEGWRFWRGTFYLWYSLVLDIFGVLFLLGLALMMLRRFAFRLPQLDYTRVDREQGGYHRAGYRKDDQVFLWLLLVIGLTGFGLEAQRIALDRPPFEVWSVVGWQLANVLDAAGLASEGRFALVWWVHALLSLAFVAYIPYSKAVHMLVDVASLLFTDPQAGKRLPKVQEDPVPAHMGYQALTDFTWKELLDLDACTKCGRCHVACPARAGGWPLSPRDLILELREVAEATWGGRSLLHEVAPRGGDGANDGSRSVAGDVIGAETLWSCTTCLACVEACPVGIEHVPMIVQMRRSLVESGTMDPNLQAVLEKVGRYGNSFGQSERNRPKWTQGLPFKVKDARKEPVELLWFVGDFAAYDPSLQEITRGVARVFQRGGLNFGILYEGERNSGNDVRRVGEEGLYQLLVEKNLAALGKAQFKEIVTTDPHSFNTLKFEYPDFGGSFRVRHYTEVLLELIQMGRLRVTNRLDATATYHDPCYLSRYAEVTEAPRAVLRSLGLTLVEMGRNRSNSFCCGAGGGRIWMSSTGTAERPSEQRIKEALEIPGVQYFVVTCPKDVTMYRDAVKTTGNEGRLAVKDLIELVEQAMTIEPMTNGGCALRSHS
jgi:Fe-S oxidoreductase/nitrate reductase gamma subunit